MNESNTVNNLEYDHLENQEDGNSSAIQLDERLKSLKYNVLYSTGNEQEYFPMLSFNGNGINKNEIQIIEEAVTGDKKDEFKHVTTVYFMSPPGLGKTVLAGHLAKKFDCPYQIINCVSTMTDLDLLGCHVLIGKETVWQDGPLPSIIRATNDQKFGILVINELNALSLNAQVALNPLMDRQECIVLTLNNNEVIKVNEDAHLLIIASMNPDIMGVNELQDSVRDRANIVIHMNYPNVNKESQLVHKITGYPERCLRNFVGVIHDCRLLKLRDHKITKVPSTRALLDWIKYTKTMGTEIAYEMTIVNRYGCNEDERNAIRVIGRGKCIAKTKLVDDIIKEKNKKELSQNAKIESKKIPISKKAFDMHENGVSVAQIARILNRSTSSVYRYLKKEKFKKK